MAYQTFHFSMLPPDVAVSIYADVRVLTTDQIRSIFDNWAMDFARNAGNFYIGRIDALHYDLARQYERENRLKPYSLGDIDCDTLEYAKWKTYLREHGYFEAQEQCRRLANHFYGLRESVAMSRPNRTALEELTELFDEIEMFATYQRYKSLAHYDLYRLWFNWTINNPLDLQKKLRRMSYLEYLKTEHWQRVRSAMLIARSAKCQAVDCYRKNAGESMWDSNDLQVHHLDYKSRGNERFDDITLLCRHHHEEWHRQQKAGNITMEICYPKAQKAGDK